MRYCILLIILWPCFVIGLAYGSGLHNMRSPDLLITSQDIYLGIEQIKIEYVFSNTTNENVRETQVFAVPLNGEDNFKPIDIFINQEPIPLQIIQRAISHSGRDISSELKALGIPYNPISAMHSIDSSSNRNSIITRLRNQKLVDLREDTPTWIVQTYCYFSYNFPALSTTTITITYKPNITTQNIKLKSFNNLMNLPIRLLKKAYITAKNLNFNNNPVTTTLQEQIEKHYPQIVKYCPNNQDYQILANSYTKHIDRKEVMTLKLLHFADGINNLLPSAIKNFSVTVESSENMHAILCWPEAPQYSDNKVKQFVAKNHIPSQDINVLYVEK